MDTGSVSGLRDVLLWSETGVTVLWNAGKPSLDPAGASTLAIASAIEDVGGDLNAATSVEHTGYFAREHAAVELANAVKQRVGVTIVVDVIDPDTLERSMGKLQRGVDQRDRT